MDKDLKRVVDETILEVFKDASEKLVERGVREIQYDICPHCKKEIYERHEYTEDGGISWRHSECKGLIARPATPMEQISDWFKPYVKEANQVRKLARKKLEMNEDLMPEVPDNDTMDSIKTLGKGGHPQGGPSTGDQNLGDKEFGLQENVAGLPPSGEEKYLKQEPGGTMAAVNIEETTVENKEVQILSPTRDAKFFAGEARFHNVTKMRLKVTCHRFQANIGAVSQSAYYFKVEEEP